MSIYDNNVRAIKDGLLHIEESLGNPYFTWNNNNYPCIPSSTNTNDLLGIGGFEEQIVKKLKVRKEVFSNGVYPQPQQKITLNNQTYRIAGVTDEPFNVFIVILLSSANKGV